MIGFLSSPPPPLPSIRRPPVVMSVNPWLYVVLGVALYFLWRRFGPQLQTRLQQWREAREEAREAAHMKKNPDLYRERCVKGILETPCVLRYTLL